MSAETRDQLIEQLALIEVDMDIIRKRLRSLADSLDKLLDFVEELNTLGLKRDQVRAKLDGH